jgi:hypothetical protein
MEHGEALSNNLCVRSRPAASLPDAANGEVLGLCQERYRHQEWIKFLRLIDRTRPLDRQST